MCEFRGDKLYLTDGTVIDLSKLNVEELSPIHIKLLNESFANKYDILLIRKNLHSLRNDIQNLIAEEVKYKEEMQNRGKKMWTSFINYMKDIAVLVGMLYYIFSTIK